MGSAAIATRTTATKIGRPLKILIPLIQQDIEEGDRAGMQYYADAGDKLLEAKPQVSYGSWGRWLSKNFHRSADTAQTYMRLARARAEQQKQGRSLEMPRSLNEFDGGRARRHERRAAERPFRTQLDDVDTDFYTQEKQTRDDEVSLHREMALELVDIGYKALATRLHPDRGGSKEAMARLNRVRDELKGLAKTRRFV
jgi:hypothetical protein